MIQKITGLAEQKNIVKDMGTPQLTIQRTLMKDQTYIKRVCKNILQEDFDWRKYLNPKTYYGRELCTMPLFCSYGQIGFTVYFPYQELPQIAYDWEMNRLTIDEIEYNAYFA